MVFTKASGPQLFPRRDAASAPLPWLLAVGSCCSHYSVLSCHVRSDHWPIYSRAVLAHVWELIHTTPALSSITSTKHMQRRWISPVFPILSLGICLCLRALSLQWEPNMRSCATTVFLLRESPKTLVLPCHPLLWIHHVVYVHLRLGQFGNPHTLRRFYFSAWEGSIIIPCKK